MNTLSKDRDLCIIEVTEVLNRGYSILLSSLMDKTNMFDGCLPVFWRSPCWETGLLGQSLLYNINTYTFDGAKKSQEDIGNFFYHWKKIDGEECIEIARRLIMHCTM